MVKRTVDTIFTINKTVQYQEDMVQMLRKGRLVNKKEKLKKLILRVGQVTNLRWYRTNQKKPLRTNLLRLELKTIY